MKNYNIPIVWESYKRYSVEAENLQDAIKKALDLFFSEPDSSYIEDSFSIDEIVSDEYPDETYDVNKILE